MIIINYHCQLITGSNDLNTQKNSIKWCYPLMWVLIKPFQCQGSTTTSSSCHAKKSNRHPRHNPRHLKTQEITRSLTRNTLLCLVDQSFLLLCFQGTLNMVFSLSSHCKPSMVLDSSMFSSHGLSRTLPGLSSSLEKEWLLPWFWTPWGESTSEPFDFSSSDESMENWKDVLSLD